MFVESMHPKIASRLYAPNSVLLIVSSMSRITVRGRDPHVCLDHRFARAVLLILNTEPDIPSGNGFLLSVSIGWLA